KIIRIDGLGRNNTGVAIGDTVVVRKIKTMDAEKIIIAPLDSIPPIDERYRSEEHTSELQSRFDLVCRLLLEKKKIIKYKLSNPLGAYSAYLLIPPCQSLL